MIENTREIYESLYPRIFNQHYGMCPEEFNRPFDYFEGYDYLINIIEEKNKEIERLKKREKELEENLLDILNISIEDNNIIADAIEYIEENCTEHGEGKWAYRTINADNTLNILKRVDKE